MIILPVNLFKDRLSEIKSLIGDLVNIESPSTEKQAVDRLGQRMIQECQETRGRVQVFPSKTSGDNILSSWGEGENGILLLAHLDTVFDLGTLARLPFREEEGRLYGPGVQDMKSSSAILLTILRIFNQTQWPKLPVKVLFTTDEETGSLASRELIETEAKKALVVFCLEPALASGALKTARKGTGDIELIVHGVASHAGVDHEKGRNAIEELAFHVLAAQRLTDYSQGTTVNVGLISGGTRSNVVPEHAIAQIDFRVTGMQEYQRLDHWVRHLTPAIPATRIETKIELNRPPMPRDETMARTFEKAKSIGTELGLTLTEGSTGGGSDANFVAPLGIPVLDGLGPVGDGAHSEREYVNIDSIPERAALLAALMLNWS